MMVTVTAFSQNPAGDWVPVKSVECSEKEAKKYVQMFFDMGHTKVRVG